MNPEKWGNPIIINILLCEHDEPEDDNGTWISCEVYYNYHVTDASFSYEYGSIQGVHKLPPYVDEVSNICVSLTESLYFIGRIYRKNGAFPVELIKYIIPKYSSMFSKDRITNIMVPDKIETENDFLVYIEEKIEELCNE